MMAKITISFIGTAEIKALLEKWAGEDDRSVSYILRKILEQEKERRQKEQQENKKSR